MNYTIGPEDVLEILVLGQQELGRTVEVSQDGTISFSLIGKVVACGRTPFELEKDIARKLAEEKYLLDAQVSIEVKQYGSLKVYLLGEVKNLGRYFMKGRTHIFSILAIVGPVTLYSFTVTPVYEATAQILIEVPSTPMKGIGEIEISGKQGREDYLQLIYQLLVSRGVAREVAERTNAHFGWTDNAPQPGKNPPAFSKPFYTADLHLYNLQVTPVTGFGFIGISVFNQYPEIPDILPRNSCKDT